MASMWSIQYSSTTRSMTTRSSSRMRGVPSGMRPNSCSRRAYTWSAMPRSFSLSSSTVRPESSPSGTAIWPRTRKVW